MVHHLYRYRSTKQVLDGFNELDKQQIYFCPSYELNDPVEGFKDLLWQGDEIVWRSLLKHYLLCMAFLVPFCFEGQSKFDKNIIRDVVHGVPEELPNAPIRQVYQRAAEIFLREPAAAKFVEMAAKRSIPMRRNELTFYLRTLHRFATDAILGELSSGIGPVLKRLDEEEANKLRINLSNGISNSALFLHDDEESQQKADQFFAIGELIVSQMDLITEYHHIGGPHIGISLFTKYFPSAYVAALDRLVHPDWYVACFSANPTNSSMWGTYGDRHHGVCLKFKTKPNTADMSSLQLNMLTSVSNSTLTEPEYFRSFQAMQFHPITYKPAYPAINFFQSLGNVASYKLYGFWYKSDEGRLSSIGNGMLQTDAARGAYWKSFSDSLLFKTSEWSHEEEYRLVLHSNFDLTQQANRTLDYKFEDLAGIVFGARTDREDKLRIMKIIDQKCGETHRSDFEFSEVRYVPQRAKFELCRLDLIKIRYD